MTKGQKVSKSNRARQLISMTAQKLWDRAFRKALRQYGKKSQAERIADCVVQPTPEPLESRGVSDWAGAAKSTASSKPLATSRAVSSSKSVASAKTAARKNTRSVPIRAGKRKKAA